MLDHQPVLAPVDRYEVLEFLAEGGMGSIYLGKKLGAGGFEKEVVLKQLRPEYTQQPEFIELFLREARLSASLDHGNIVHTIDLVHAGSDYFMVMEYVRGGDLRILLKRAKKRKRWLLPAAALHIAREVLSALVYAHGKQGAGGKPLGLIHRDVSPSNILLSGAGEVKLTDFGIAKATTHHSTFYRVRGKVGYMSPEQARSDELLPRSDVYSVAVILYEMLTGEKLHVAASLTTSAEEMYAQPVPSVSSKLKVPAELDNVLWRGLAVNPDARYQSAREMLEAVQDIASRYDLGFNALALARHLVEVCGPVEEWGSSVVREPTVPGPGTEAYAQAPPGNATADLAPVSSASSKEDSNDDLLWVDKLGGGAPGGVRRRAESQGDNGLARLASAELRPVEEFIAARVVSVEPSVVGPRRRLKPLAVALGLAAAAAALAFVFTQGERGPLAPAPAAAPAAPPVKPPPPQKKVAVDSEPSRARLLLDGQVRCATPCTFDAPAGEPRLVSLEREGYLPWTALVVAGSDEPWKARLRREPQNAATWGQVALLNAPQANLLVDGKPAGYATPAETPLSLPAGEHTLALLPPGEKTKPARELKVNIRAGAATEIDLAAE